MYMVNTEYAMFSIVWDQIHLTICIQLKNLKKKLNKNLLLFYFYM